MKIFPNVPLKGYFPLNLNGVLSARLLSWKRGKMSRNRSLALRSLREVKGKCKGKILLALQ